MDDAQKAAYVYAQSICAQAEIEGMRAENEQRKVLGQSMAYHYDDFERVPAAFGITHNQIMELFHN